MTKGCIVRRRLSGREEQREMKIEGSKERLEEAGKEQYKMRRA
jgi:hypothetical protein